MYQFPVSAPDELRANSGCICALQRHPTKPTKVLMRSAFIISLMYLR